MSLLSERNTRTKGFFKKIFIGLMFTCYCLKDEVLSRGNVSSTKKCLHSRNGSQNSYNYREHSILADKTTRYFPTVFISYPEHCQYGLPHTVCKQLPSKSDFCLDIFVLPLCKVYFFFRGFAHKIPCVNINHKYSFIKLQPHLLILQDHSQCHLI